MLRSYSYPSSHERVLPKSKGRLPRSGTHGRATATGCSQAQVVIFLHPSSDLLQEISLLHLQCPMIFSDQMIYDLLDVYVTSLSLMCHRHTLYFLRKNLCCFLSVLVTLTLPTTSATGNSHLCLCTQAFIKSWSFTFLI